MISSASVRPAWSRKTAHFSFIIVPSSSLISEIRRPPPCSRRRMPWIIFSSAASCVAGGRGHRHRAGPLRGVGAGAAAEDQRVQQRVGPEPVAAVDGDAGDLAGRVEAGDRRLAVHVGLDAAHDVVAAGLDVDRLARDVHAREVAADVDDLAQRLERALARHLRDVERDGAVREAAALVDLRLLRARDDVARGELHLVGRVLLHEALALGVVEVRALAAGALRDQDPVPGQRGRVVLDHLHVHQRGADAVGLRDPVARADQGVGGRLEALARRRRRRGSSTWRRTAPSRRRGCCGRSRRSSCPRRPARAR